MNNPYVSADLIRLSVVASIQPVEELLAHVHESLAGAEEAFRAFDRLFAQIEAGATVTPALAADGRRAAGTATAMLQQLRLQVEASRAGVSDALRGLKSSMSEGGGGEGRES
jgi:hypothetical protein